MKTNYNRAVACIRFVGLRCALLLLAVTVGIPYIVMLLFVAPAGMCVDDPTDPIHSILDPLFWWGRKWRESKPNAVALPTASEERR